LGALSFHRSMAQPEPPTPSSSSETARVEASRGPNSDPPWRAVMGDISSTPRCSDVLVLGNEELGLPGFPRAPLLLTNWGRRAGMLTNRDYTLAAMGDTSHGCLRRSTTGPGESKKITSSDLSRFFLLWLMLPHLQFFIQRLARDAAEVATLREEVTRVQADAVMARARAA
jgi:hypothetical protein